MPNANRIQSLYVSTGNPDTVNDSTLLRPGELGAAYDVTDRAYQLVQCDSGATAATPAGVVAANELAYWKDRSNYLVTNDSRFGLLSGIANSQRNNVAGIFRNAVTAGNYCFVLQRGRNISVKEVGSATAGMTLCASTSTTAADALGTAIGTSSPTQQIGIVVTATSGTTCVADVDIPNIP
jgi:hypothetical protein